MRRICVDLNAYDRFQSNTILTAFGAASVSFFFRNLAASQEGCNAAPPALGAGADTGAITGLLAK
jgi:hypothetical protein